MEREIDELFKNWKKANRRGLLFCSFATIFMIAFLVVMAPFSDVIAIAAILNPSGTWQDIPIEYLNVFFKTVQIIFPFMIGVLWEQYRNSVNKLAAAKADIELNQAFVDLRGRVEKLEAIEAEKMSKKGKMIVSKATRGENNRT
jgi:hypothetical protein